MNGQRERGAITIEACVAVTVFIFLMLFLYSLFIVFETRNELAHVVLATADSLALDTYEIDKLDNSGTLADFLSPIFNHHYTEDSGFSSGEVWNQIAAGSSDANSSAGTPKKGEDRYKGWDKSIYTSDTIDGSSQGKVSSVFSGVIKDRFIAYLADGDQKKADDLLKKRYHVHDGLNGISFTGSHISSGKIYVTIRYKLDLEYSGLLIGRSEKGFVEFEQSACSKLWS